MNNTEALIQFDKLEDGQIIIKISDPKQSEQMVHIDRALIEYDKWYALDINQSQKVTHVGNQQLQDILDGIEERNSKKQNDMLKRIKLDTTKHMIDSIQRMRENIDEQIEKLTIEQLEQLKDLRSQMYEITRQVNQIICHQI